MRECRSKYHQGDRLIDDALFASPRRCKECASISRKRYRATPKGQETIRVWTDSNLEQTRKRSREHHYVFKHTKKYMFNNAKRRAKKDGLDFTITHDDIVIPEFCPVLGLPLEISEGGRTGRTPSLDRLDNNQGYIPGNVFVISWRANYAKRDMIIEEIVLLYRYMIMNSAKLKQLSMEVVHDGKEIQP